MTITIYRRTHTHHRRPILTKWILSPLLFFHLWNASMLKKHTLCIHFTLIRCMNHARVRKPSTWCNHCPQLLPHHPAPQLPTASATHGLFCENSSCLLKPKGPRTYSSHEDPEPVYIGQKDPKLIYSSQKDPGQLCWLKGHRIILYRKDPEIICSVQRTQNLSKLAKRPRNYLCWPKNPEHI